MPQRLKHAPNAAGEAMKREALATMHDARTAMLAKFPFLGALAMRLRIVPVLDERLPVACTDGEAVYVNAYAVEHPEKVFKRQFRCRELSGKDDCALAILAHEVWHNALLHFDRRGDMEARRFNVASDIEIGFLLNKAGIVHLSDAGCDPMYRGMPAEKIYQLIGPFRRTASPLLSGGRVRIPVSSPSGGEPADDIAGEPCDGVPGAKTEAGAKKNSANASSASAGTAAPREGYFADSFSGDGQGNEIGDVSRDGRSGRENGANARGNRTGAESGAGNVEKDDLGEGFVEGHYNRYVTYPPMRSMEPEFGNKNMRDPDFSPAEERPDGEAEKIGREWREAVRKAADRHGVPGHRPGTMPGNLEEVISADRNNTLDWKQLLLDFVSRTLGGDRQWLPPSRRYVWKKLYLPRRKDKPYIEIVLAVDTSGSTVDDLPDFLAELRGMMAAFGDYRITVMQCDTKIRSVKDYTNDDPLPEKLNFYGLGGTSLRPPFEYVESQMASLPNVFIYLTDGFGDVPDKIPEYPVIWCLTAGGEKPADWGWEVKINRK